MLKPGAYELLINRRIAGELSAIPQERKATEAIEPAEAAGILSEYVADAVKSALTHMEECEDGVSRQVAFVNQLLKQVAESEEDAVDASGTQLLELLHEKDALLAAGKTARDAERPETSLSHSSLFTGAVHEPQMFTELKKEIRSCDRIDMLVSFIKWSGLRLIIEELGDFTRNGGKLRIITTSYMGATDIKAVEALASLDNTEIKVSYDTKRTRLHAKTYVFYRGTGFTTAYVGSSNLSRAAMSSGLEWNLKITAKDQPSAMKKIAATFDSYWNSEEFELYGHETYDRLKRALKAERKHGSVSGFFFDIYPYPYQSEILEKLNAERTVRGFCRNLVVAATGTGKTVISAFDYRNFCKQRPGKANRLLFVAHREEILRQSMETFQAVLKDPNFGEMYVGSFKPDTMDYLFVSVQTVNSQALYEKLPKDYYDYIVVDEFHHAAAPTYRRLLEYFTPQILLGLTATPERMDGKSILDYFGGRIAAEIRLPEAIDRKLLCPFQYFGVSDTVDLDDLKWTRGGYDRTELSNLYALNREIAERRADHILRSIDRYVTDLETVKGLGFCVSVEHARFMAEYMNTHGLPSMELDGSTPDDIRTDAKRQLVSGEIRFLFVVDIYNEGVDIPEINTVLFLRPTESLTVFLQQLGRGLRLHESKDCLTVLDFVGQANRKYNFEEKFTALLSQNTRGIQSEIRNGFVSVPKGCYIRLEKKAERIILENIRSSFNGKSGIVARIASFTEDTGKELTLRSFVSHYHLDLRVLYAKASFSRLCALANVRDDFSEPAEETLTKALPRLAAIDSRRWIRFLLGFLPKIADTDPASLSEAEQRMLRMFYVTVWMKPAEDLSDDEVLENLYSLAESPVMLAELLNLLELRYECIDFIDAPVDLGFDCPLDLYCTYTRDQILLGMDFMKPSTVREGVKWLPEKQADLLFVTLNKSGKDYSPTTMYNDYSINSSLFHWQSQSTTSESGSTGQRYIHHRQSGSKVLLFVREFKNDVSGAAPYTFLGTAGYVKHEGSRPMNIIWQLDAPIPAKYLKKTNQLVI